MIYYGMPVFSNYEFEHHGVKGMRWGVRKRPSRSTGLIKKKKSAFPPVKKEKGNQEDKPKVSTAKKTNVHNHKKMSEMSDNELKDYINRLRDEQTYKELLTKELPISKGKKFMNKFRETLKVTAELTENATKIYNNFNTVKSKVKGNSDSDKKDDNSSNGKKNKSKQKQSQKDSSETKSNSSTEAKTGTVEGEPRSSAARGQHGTKWGKRNSGPSPIIDVDFEVVNDAYQTASNFSNAFKMIRSATGNTPLIALPPASTFDDMFGS